MRIPNAGQTVKFNQADFKFIKCDMGGKCKIKKLNLPNKGQVLNYVDINELSF